MTSGKATDVFYGHRGWLVFPSGMVFHYCKEDQKPRKRNMCLTPAHGLIWKSGEEQKNRVLSSFFIILPGNFRAIWEYSPNFWKRTCDYRQCTWRASGADRKHWDIQAISGPLKDPQNSSHGPVQVGSIDDMFPPHLWGRYTDIDLWLLCHVTSMYLI